MFILSLSTLSFSFETGLTVNLGLTGVFCFILLLEKLVISKHHLPSYLCLPQLQCWGYITCSQPHPG